MHSVKSLCPYKGKAQSACTSEVRGRPGIFLNLLKNIMILKLAQNLLYRGNAANDPTFY